VLLALGYALISVAVTATAMVRRDATSRLVVRIPFLVRTANT
jgi:hypothetical protein